MQLAIDPPVPFLIPPGPIRIVQIGCGGTGSHLADTIARLMTHQRQNREPVPECILIDGDQVEPKNVGRQRFSPADIGANKAKALSARLNAAYGLTISAIPQMADAALLGSLHVHGTYTIIVGCVDTPAARKEIAANMPARALWIDCGNDDTTGQVLVGNRTDRARCTDLFTAGLCTALPAPSVQSPDLIKAPPKRAVLACADAVAANHQALLINQLVATVAGQYLVDLLTARRIATFQTWIDLAGHGMRSTSITPNAVARVLACDPATLITKGRAA